eukprot:TRINITY_DN7716_c1_g1_i1.p1 TRINITY_DN7716_c1_g1~~TRINITY_DN7716_c1_g1_i1.p1  ORF type:complete len:136 (+),score=12.79 TRINITY_DN7716_c1_g1_i1:31-438(+)
MKKKKKKTILSTSFKMGKQQVEYYVRSKANQVTVYSITLTIFSLLMQIKGNKLWEKISQKYNHPEVVTMTTCSMLVYWILSLFFRGRGFEIITEFYDQTQNLERFHRKFEDLFIGRCARASPTNFRDLSANAFIL